jgi:hypothetical protein
MAMSGSSVRDTSRGVRGGITMVMAHLKKLKPVKVNPQLIQAIIEHHEVELVCEMDE